MALTSTPVFVQTPNTGIVQIANADTSNSKYVMMGGANASKITGIFMASTEQGSNNRIVQIFIGRSGTNYLIGSANVAANSGADNLVATVNGFGQSLLGGSLPLDSDGAPYLFMKSGDTLNVASTTTLTSGKVINVVAIFGDF